MYPHQSMSHYPVLPTPRNPYVIKVTGEGTISAAPDQAVAILGTITENRNLQLAQAENAEAVSRVIQSLTNLGIPQELLKTLRYQIEIQYQYQDGRQIFQGYKVTHMLQVIIGQIEQTGLVVDTAVEHGANTVSSIQFTLRDPEYFYNQALSTAVKDSQQKPQRSQGHSVSDTTLFLIRCKSLPQLLRLFRLEPRHSLPERPPRSSLVKSKFVHP